LIQQQLGCQQQQGLQTASNRKEHNRSGDEARNSQDGLTMIAGMLEKDEKPTKAWPSSAE
jgi:hypothetical protein